MTIPAISDRIACGTIGSIGTDISVFPTPGHLASWAGVCPGNNRSAGRDISSATTHGDPYLRGWLGIAAGIIAQTHSRPNYLKSYYQRLRKRRGPSRAPGRCPAQDPHRHLAHAHPRRRLPRPRT